MEKNVIANNDCSSIKKGDKKIYNSRGEHLLTINDVNITNKEGVQIARFQGYRRKGFSKIAVYSSPNGEYTFSKNKLTHNNQILGWSLQKVRYIPVFVILAAFIFMISTSIVSFNHIQIEEDFKPVVVVSDINGAWNSKDTVVVFDQKIYPGKSGEYKFSIVNTNEYEVNYSFVLNHFYNGIEIKTFPLVYKIKLGNKYLTENWLQAKDLSFDDITVFANESQVFTLVWEWPFENGKDNIDTRYGIRSGVYSISMTLSAQLNVR